MEENRTPEYQNMKSFYCKCERINKLRLAEPTKEHEAQAKELVREIRAAKSAFRGCARLEEYINVGNYDGWLQRIERQRTPTSDTNALPISTYFLVRCEGCSRPCLGICNERIIGIVSIRLGMSQDIWEHQSNFEYCIRPSLRGKGYSRIAAYLAFYVCMQAGMDMALITCDIDEKAVITVIQDMGGIVLAEFNEDRGGESVTVRKYVLMQHLTSSICFSLYHQYIVEYPKISQS